MRLGALAATAALHAALLALLAGGFARQAQTPTERRAAVAVLPPEATPRPPVPPSRQNLTPTRIRMPMPALAPLAPPAIDIATEPARAIAIAPSEPPAPEPPGIDRRSDAASLAPVEARLEPAALPPSHGACVEQQRARHYPALLRERGIEGRVLLHVHVDARGQAIDVRVAGGSGWRLLDEAARLVARACPYRPARRGDEPLASWIEYPVRFALSATAAP